MTLSDYPIRKTSAKSCETGCRSLAREASSSGALPTGRHQTNLELGFRQCSFHHTMQVLRNHDFCAFSSPSALPPCYVPLCLSTSSKAADLWNIPSISRPLVWRYEVSCHGARRVDRGRGPIALPFPPVPLQTVLATF